MSMTSLPRLADEVGRLGTDLLSRVIEPMLAPDQAGRFIAVDVNTGEYELNDDDYTAVHRLRDRLPGADVWLARVGEEASDRIGFR